MACHCASAAHDTAFSHSFALFGVVMIVLSGTRNATAALGCAIIFLSIALRSKVVFYAAGIAGFAAAVSVPSCW